ncbi:MAG: hypothetical protein GX247_04020 [Mollicutes bacterium]|jgi:hypothetical protein|nr:hypothetical protein [Mollicutes bacterium]
MKFEPNVEGSACYGTYEPELCNLTTLVPKSLPNKYPWRYATPNTFFIVGRNLEKNTTYS